MEPKQLTEAEKRVVELERMKTEVIKPFYEQYAAALEALFLESGAGHYFQDDENIVYKTVRPEGKFVQFEKFGINRTRRPDERSGTLSVKEAKEAGFEV